MKHLVASLEHHPLNAAVARLEGFKLDAQGRIITGFPDGGPFMYAPSENWAQGGPIIERERIAIWRYDTPGDVNGWLANFGAVHGSADGGIVATDPPHDREAVVGPTPLIAAMRAYVANKCGEEVELP